MTISNSRLAYKDCYQIFDAAMDDSKGIRIKVEDMDAATFLRMRLHQARVLERQHNAKVYEPDHKMHGCCIYDIVTIKIRPQVNDGIVYVVLERNDSVRGEIEKLSEIEDGSEPTPAPEPAGKNDEIDWDRTVAPEPRTGNRPLRRL
jgi:hypothetical protein